jgi:hypothetical protein
MKNQYFKPHKGIGSLLVVTILLLSSCATRSFVCTSVPDHALISVHISPDLDSKSYITSTAETPANLKLQFLGKSDQYYLTAEKRGFLPVTTVVNKDSSLNKTFNLQKIEGVSDVIYPKENLKNATFYLLPPKINFLYHKGSGSFQRYEYSEKDSKKIREDYMKEVSSRNNPPLYLLNIEGKNGCKAYKDSIPNEMSDYLAEINAKRLNYYAKAPSIDSLTRKFGDIRETLQNHALANNHQYFVCISAKCVAQTAGRVVGEIFLTAASSSYVATMDTGTTLSLYVIDAKTLEVVHVNNTFYKQNMAKPADLKEVNDAVTKYLSNL